MSNSTEPHPSLDDPNAFVFYRYHPSAAAAIVFMLLFMGSTIIHMYQMWMKKAWYFTPFIIGGVQIVGYIGRASSSKDQWSLTPYLVQTLCLLVAPALFAASIYMVLGRVILLVQGERCSLIPKKWLTKLFVTGDVLSFLLQAGGGGIMSSGSGVSSMKTGEHVIIIGLFVQLVFFGFFLIVATTFHKRIRKAPTPLSAPTSVIGRTWEKYLLMLYLVSLFIMVRSIFRVAEYIGGNDGAIMRHEIYIYIFDAFLMFIVMLLFIIKHPGELTLLGKGLEGQELDGLTSGGQKGRSRRK